MIFTRKNNLPEAGTSFKQFRPRFIVRKLCLTCLNIDL